MVALEWHAGGCGSVLAEVAVTAGTAAMIEASELVEIVSPEAAAVFGCVRGISKWSSGF